MFDFYLSGWPKLYMHDVIWKRDFWCYRISCVSTTTARSCAHCVFDNIQNAMALAQFKLKKADAST